MPRQARLDAPGTLHHVILRGIEKKKIVDDRHDRKTFIEFMGIGTLFNYSITFDFDMRRKRNVLKLLSYIVARTIR